MDVADHSPSETSTAALPFDVFARACPSRPVLEHLTGRWGTLVLAGLADGPLRFGDLRRRIDGVSEKMLAQTLQQLERDGFVHREVRRAIPPHVEYSLTGLGAETAPRLLDLIGFLEARMPEVLDAQRRHTESRTDTAP
ncbi:winged helix-turn-helix transcriptional regulator [Nocardia testacea]|uniref:Winged helix-turn-helix transcriptional regulator n=1 Tax=Nocardia testacea TaxID=248551 RepID=A0ABW7W3A8_9NOCA